MSQRARTPRLHGFYHQFLADQDPEGFGTSVREQYSIGTLERLAVMGDRMTRRAAVMALGQVADYASNAVLGRALSDEDRGVRTIAEQGIRQLWCRVGTAQDRERLASLIELNANQRFTQAIKLASRLIQRAPWIAECWNQRALALYSVGRYNEAIRDCQQTLEINPYHFGAASGIGQCQLRLHNRQGALDWFRKALSLNPGLEGVRAQVLYLERSLHGQE